MISQAFLLLQERTLTFQKKTGRRPRILLASLPQETDTHAVKVAATAYADAGFDVDISPVCTAPELVARMAVENDVHVVGIVGGSEPERGGMADNILSILEQEGAEDINVFVDKDRLIEKKRDRCPDFDSLAAASADRTLAAIGA